MIGMVLWYFDLEEGEVELVDVVFVEGDGGSWGVYGPVPVDAC